MSDFLNHQIDFTTRYFRSKFYHPEADRAGDTLYFKQNSPPLFTICIFISDFPNYCSKFYPEADRTGNALYFKATSRLVPITDIFSDNIPEANKGETQVILVIL